MAAPGGAGPSGPPPPVFPPSQSPHLNAQYIENYNFPFCEEVSKYEKLAKIGQGTFGEVFKARDKKNKGKIVALKKVLMDNEKEGFPITALREIKILQLLRNENIVNLIEICRSRATQYNRHKSTFYLVFDFCEHDLAGLLSNYNVKFSLGEIKKVMQQLLNGLYFIHSSKIIHRDMKAANVLITKQGILKLADFGLARAISINKSGQPNRYTNRVVTLWYRPPELLLGERNYGPPVDMWGAGCIMAEMWTRSPIMQGNTEQHQLTLIAQLCGAITPEAWPGVENLELYSKLDIPKKPRRVRERLRPYVKDQYAVDLLDKLLCLNPARRIDANSALDHDFFWTDPMPVSLEKMLSQHTQSMFEFLAPRRLSGTQHRMGGQQGALAGGGGGAASASGPVGQGMMAGGAIGGGPIGAAGPVMGGVAGGGPSSSGVGGVVAAAAAAGGAVGRHGHHHGRGRASHSHSSAGGGGGIVPEGSYMDRVF